MGIAHNLMEKSTAEPIIPFLKWAGGKQWLVPWLQPIIHSNKGKYVEPFLGGGSVFFSIRPKDAWLSDSNEELIETYRTIRTNPETVIRRLHAFSFDEKCFLRVRKSRPRSPEGKAARFIYLNRTCWNGLYRVNRNGDFNVPMGSFEYNPDFVVADRLRMAQSALKSAKLRCMDFEEACEPAGAGDTVYLDPPYTVAHKNNGFLRYNERVFSWDDQQRLARVAKELKRKGCRVIVSNADHPNVINLYLGFSIKRISRKSLVAGEVIQRRIISELLIASFAL